MKVNNTTPNIGFSKVANNRKNVSFSGMPNLENCGWLKRAGALGRNGALTEKLFLWNAFAFLLGGRLATSRDKNEVRETLTRDVPTIVIAVYGVKWLQEGFAKFIQDKTGFVIGHSKGESKNGFMNAINKRTLTVADNSQIKDWYKYDENIATGFDGFTRRLADKGGNLKKIYSKLGETIKSRIANFSADNDAFIKELSANNTLKEEIKKALTEKGNSAFVHASFLKTLPSALGLFTTLCALGIFIPKFNIHLTEKLCKHKKEKEEAMKAEMEKQKQPEQSNSGQPTKVEDTKKA